MKLKVLALTLAVTLSISIGVSADELTNSGFNKYRERLVEIGHTEEEVLQMEKEYNIDKMNRNDSEVVILEPERAGGSGIYFGHTSSVYVNTNQVVEALGGQVSSLNFTASKWNDFNSKQYWMWVPRYDSYTRARADNNGFQYLNKPYSLLASKTHTDKFYYSLLNWRQYKDIGIDLDVDGGPMVFPFDIYWHDDVAIYLTQ